MKIIIVGGGISGLSAYLFLKKQLPLGISDLSITIYESHDPAKKVDPENLTFGQLSSSTTIVGGGIGLMPNGMQVLGDLDPAVHDAAVKGGFPVDIFEFRSARGWKLQSSDSIRGREWTDGKQERCVSMMRHTLWQALMDKVDKKDIVYKKVARVEQGDLKSGKKPVIILEGDSDSAQETTDQADLIIGADGVKSKVLTGIFGDDKNMLPTFEGLLGVGGHAENWIPDPIRKDRSMVFEFGNNGFFGYAAASETMGMWWSTCQADNIPANKRLDPEELKAQLKKRHAHWKDPIVHEYIEKSGVSQIYPTYSTPDLPTWSGPGLVLVGDAAHALHSTSGQGASMALEDSQCLTMLLSKYIAESRKDDSKLSNDEAVALSLKSFYTLRHGRVKKISDRAKMMAGSKHDMPFIAEMMLCGMMWLMGKFPVLGKALMGDVNEELFFSWNVDKATDEEVKKTIMSLGAAGKVNLEVAA